MYSYFEGEGQTQSWSTEFIKNKTKKSEWFNGEKDRLYILKKTLCKLLFTLCTKHIGFFSSAAPALIRET